MDMRGSLLTPVVSRRSVLKGGAALLASGMLPAGLWAPRPARADFNLIFQEWGPLAGYGVDAECNPGGGSFSCGPGDVSIADGSDGTDQYSQVTANPNGNVTYVNAIGNIHFQDNTPDGQPVRLTTYQYVYAIRLPLRPTTSSAPWIAEQTHEMIMFWDGSNRLWNANQHTLEAASFWKLNPWDPNYGKIFVYSRDGGGGLTRVDTGIFLDPDTKWHVFDVRADLANQVYAGIAIDGQWNPLSGVPLASIYHPDWGPDLSLILTAESENAYPGQSNVTQWTTQFKDPKLFRLD